MEVLRFENQGRLTESLARLLRETMEAGCDAPFAIMLSGGSTPLPAYALLGAEPPKIASGLHLFFSDERHVPTSSGQSNLGAIRPMIRGLALPEERVLRVWTELPLEAATMDYDARLAGFLNRGGSIPLGLLGLGADGHTASLFTLDDIERARRGLAVAVPRPQPPDRVSVTPNLLEKIERVVFALCGEDKMDILETLLKSPRSIPAGRAVENCARVEVWASP